jgi:hypothetical protein
MWAVADRVLCGEKKQKDELKLPRKEKISRFSKKKRQLFPRKITAGWNA